MEGVRARGGWGQCGWPRPLNSTNCRRSSAETDGPHVSMATSKSSTTTSRGHTCTSLYHQSSYNYIILLYTSYNVQYTQGWARTSSPVCAPAGARGQRGCWRWLRAGWHCTAAAAAQPPAASGGLPPAPSPVAAEPLRPGGPGHCRSSPQSAQQPSPRPCCSGQHRLSRDVAAVVHCEPPCGNVITAWDTSTQTCSRCPDLAGNDMSIFF